MANKSGFFHQYRSIDDGLARSLGADIDGGNRVAGSEFCQEAFGGREFYILGLAGCLLSEAKAGEEVAGQERNGE